MHILFSILLLIVQLMLSHFWQAQIYGVADNIVSNEVFAQVDMDSDEEELVYNGKVYFDEDVWNFDLSTEKKEDKQVETKKFDVVDKLDIVYNDDENISSLEESEEEEIIFHDDFDTWYREDLEEIWAE